MKKRIENFLRKLLPPPPPPPEKEKDNNNKNERHTTPITKFNNCAFAEQLLVHFEEQLKFNSWRQRMLYPMSFDIILHPSDLQQVQQSFPFLFPEIVAEFYKIISKHSQEHPKYKSPARHWVFKVHSSDIAKITTPKGEELEIEKGKVTTIATLYTVNNQPTGNNVNVENNVRVSVRVGDSNVEDYGDINIERPEINMRGKNMFIYPFDISLPTDSDEIQTIDKMPDIAIISYELGGKRYSYGMKDHDIIISGKNDKRTDYDVFKIEHADIINTHAEVKYQPHLKKFQIAVYGETILNERSLDISTGGSPIWYDLGNNSQIYIASGDIMLNFEIVQK